MKNTKTGLFWFTNDLRLHDNPSLMMANTVVDRLLCVFVIDRFWWATNKYIANDVNENANAFLTESLIDLDKSLNDIGQQLIVIESSAITALSFLTEEFSVTDIFHSNNAGWYENKSWHTFKQTQSSVNFHSIDSHTLFDLESLPFNLEALPTSFTKFKKTLSDIDSYKPIKKISYLPPPPELKTIKPLAINKPSQGRPFKGGETSGLLHLDSYFSSEKPLIYKQVRNSIDGWDNSSKLSPWLANGCLSVREIMATLSEYEKNRGANESIYWIYFELLWQEYFQWYAHKNGAHLFAFNGIKRLSPLNSYYPERFQKWINGSTPYPLVNACMNELRQTGYLSNRGRQIVASCFVNELAMDWRYGAAYFEQVLIDYDVASNWGNWQYLDGAGADTRDKRHFNH